MRVFTKLILLSSILAGLMTSSSIYAQDLLDDVGLDVNESETNNAVFSETIKIISRSGKIFILTNENQQLSKGDFVSMALKEGGAVARAVVAKTHEGRVGIKILKVYSLARWSFLRNGLVVNLIKGDDSLLFAKKKAITEDDTASKIESEEDLYNEKAILDEDLSDFYKDNRHIKPDNIVTAAYSQLRFKDLSTTDTIAGNQFNFTWAYQFADNFWVEALYGRTSLNDFPGKASQTIINNLTARIKYNFKAPLYSFFIPYIGVKTVKVSSPNAGVATNTTLAAANLAQLELDTIKSLEKTQLAIGVTILRRLVPGWFLKADIGTDILSIGFGIEF